MASPYAKKIDIPTLKGPSSRARDDAAGRARLLEMLAGAAPIAGSVIGGALGIPGGPAGMAAGSMIGGGVGKLAGVGLDAAAGEQTADLEEQDRARRERLAMARSILSQMR